MQFKSGGGEEDSKSYVRLKDGESVTGVLTGEPYEFYKHWLNNRSELCSGASCPVCKETGKRGSFSFRLNFVTKDESGNYVAKVFEQGWKVYQALRELNEEYPLESSVVKIGRKGNGMDTTYSILPIRNPLVTPELAAKIKALKLIDLRHGEDRVAGSPAQGDPGNQAPPHTDDDIPW